MSERTVDARGMLCPKPLIMVKAAMEELQVGQTLMVLLDNLTACENVQRFLDDHKANPERQKREGMYVLRAMKSPVHLAEHAETWCTPSPQVYAIRPPVVVVHRQYMGDGPEDLGRILMQAAMNTLPELRPVPSAVVFYNSGIHLTCEGSPVLAALANLETQGVQLLVCGTCLEYFQRKTQCKAGVVSNMYDILKTMSSGGPVIHL